MTLSKLVLLIMSCVVFIMVSCIKETFDGDKLTETDWNPELCAHVIHSDLTVYNLAKADPNTIIKKDDKNFVTIIYKNTIFSKTADELINIPGQSYSNLLSFSVPVIFPANSTSQTNYPAEYDFSLPNNMIIDSISLESIKVHVHFTFNVNANVNISISTTNITLNGSPYNISIKHNYLGFPTESIDTTFRLTGYKITFDNTGVLKNKFPFNIKAIATSVGNSVNNPYNITANISMDSIKFQKIFGYLGQMLTSIDEDTVKVKIFDNDLKGSFQFVDPKFDLFIKNSFGIPIRLNLNKLISHSDKNNPFNVQIIGVPNPWDVNAAAKIGDFDSSQIQLNKDYSNILNAFSISPTEFYHQFDVRTNPNGYVSQNFALAKSSIQVDGEAEIPLYCSASGYVLQDTEKVDLKDITGNSDKIEYLNLLLRINNNFPLESKIQLYMVDSNYTWPPIDSLLNFNEAIIGAATPGPMPDLKSLDPVVIKKTILLSGSRVRKWDKVKYFIIKATLNTYNKGVVPVKIYSDNHLIIDIGIQTKFKIKFK